MKCRHIHFTTADCLGDKLTDLISLGSFYVANDIIGTQVQILCQVQQLHIFFTVTLFCFSLCSTQMILILAVIQLKNEKNPKQFIYRIRKSAVHCFRGEPVYMTMAWLELARSRRNDCNKHMWPSTMKWVVMRQACFCSSKEFSTGVWKCQFWEFGCDCLRNHLSLFCNMKIAYVSVFHGQKHDFNLTLLF